MKVPDDRRYAPGHLWVKKDGELCLVGITEYAQEQLGQVIYADIQIQGSPDPGVFFGMLESVKATVQLPMPLAGSIEFANRILDEAPDLINQDCYDAGWLVKIRPNDWADYERLQDAEDYVRQIEEK